MFVRSVANGVKTLLIPAFISLAIYLLFSYLILPLVRQHRHRYNHYLPLDTISSHTTSIRHRVLDFVVSRIVPSTWARDRNSRLVDGSGRLHDDADSLFDEEEGEDMVGFDMDPRRREALDRRRSEADEGERRLSRDLEEGFRDDSDEEAEPRGTAEITRGR